MVTSTASARSDATRQGLGSTGLKNMATPSKPSASSTSTGKRMPTNLAGIEANITNGQEKEPSGRRIVTRLQARTAATATGKASGANSTDAAAAEKGHAGENGATSRTSGRPNKRASNATSTSDKSRASMGASSSVSASDGTAAVPASKRTSARLAHSSSDKMTSSSSLLSGRGNNSNHLSSERAGANTPRKAASKRTSLASGNAMGVSSPGPPTTPRPKFSTWQQQYTPARSTGAGSPAKGAHQQPHGRQPTLNQLRKQTELVQLSLLHAAGVGNFKAWERSAKAQLATHFGTLATTYRSVLTLQRQARQHSNMLALHQWSGGNSVALVRKSSTLLSVLAEVCALTAPGGGGGSDGGVQLLLGKKGHGDIDENSISGGADSNNGESGSDNGETGAYAAVVQQFEAWATWVLDVWHERDLQQAEHQQFLARLRSEQWGMFEEEQMIREYKQQHQGQVGQGQFTRIDGLGDAVKAELRRLDTVLNALEGRLLELSSPSIPEYPLIEAGVFPSSSSQPPPHLGDDEGQDNTTAARMHKHSDNNHHDNTHDNNDRRDMDMDIDMEMNEADTVAAPTSASAPAPAAAVIHADAEAEAEAEEKEEEEEEDNNNDDNNNNNNNNNIMVATPRRILDITTAMVRNMKEELQLMRELDFEVVIGEQAWVEWKVHGIGNEIERLLL